MSVVLWVSCMRRASRRSKVGRLYPLKSWPVRTRNWVRIWDSICSATSVRGSPSAGNWTKARVCLAATNCLARSATGATMSTNPVAIALRGMLSYSASSGACTSSSPPCPLMAWIPTAPSLPEPDRMMAAPSPCSSAKERKKLSICMWRPRMVESSFNSRLLPLTTRLLAGGMT